MFAGVLACLTAGCAGQRARWNRPFRIGVYLNNQASVKHVFRELADAGVDLVWIGGGNYGKMVEEGLHHLAHAYDIDIYLQLFAEPRLRHPPEEQRERIAAALEAR